MSRRFALIGAGVIAVVLARPTPLAGQAEATPPDGQRLTLADVLRIVRLRQPALSLASARRQLVTGQARQEAAFANPVVEWRREGTGSAPITDAFLTVTQPLDLTGRRITLRAAAAAVDRRAIADSATIARVTAADAVRAYWRASLARALLTLAAEHRADAERLAATDSARAGEGAIAESWAMRAALEAERARLVEAGAVTEWARARVDLARTLAISADSLPPVGELSPPSVSLDAAPTSDGMMQVARSARTELASARAAQDAARLRERAATLGVLGDVALQTGQKRTAGQTMGVIALTMPLPLWNRSTGARAAATAERRAAAAEERAVDIGVEADVIGAVESYRALLAARPGGAAPLAARATDVARIAEAAYAAGGISLVELLDARRARAESIAALLRWSAEVRLAQLELVRAAGQPFTDLLENP